MGGKKRFSLKTWHLLLILPPLLFLAATLLRSDHLKMVELRDAVITADQSGDIATLEQSLKDLQDFTFNHIVINITEENGRTKVDFGTGVFYLEQQYYRAATKALEDAEAQLSSDTNPHGNIYSKATAVCQPQAIAHGWRWNSPAHIDCMLSELAKYPASSTIEDTIIADLPSPELYRISYASPLWAPTFSGIVILLSLLLIVVIFIHFLIWCIFNLALLFLGKA